MKPSEALEAIIEELDDLFVTREGDIYIHVSKRDDWCTRLEDVRRQTEQLEVEVLRLINQSIFDSSSEVSDSAEAVLGEKVAHMKNEVEKLLKTLKD